MTQPTDLSGHLYRNIPRKFNTVEFLEDLTQVFYKITNKEENHHGFQYKDGLNVLTEPFNSNPNDSCCAGGFYFTDAKNIFRFINYGCNVREITLPLTDPEFRIVKDPEGDKWRANKIIFGKRYDLWTVDTFEILMKKGVDIHADDDYVFQRASANGKFEIVNFLVEKGADIHADNDCALGWASKNGHLEIVKYLVEKGANIHADYDCALGWASKNGHLEIVKYLVETVKYLVEKGASIHVCDDYALKWAFRNGYSEIVTFLQNYQKIENKIVN